MDPQPGTPGPRPQPVLRAAQVSAVATWATALLVGYLARRGLLVPEELEGPIADLIAVGIVAAVGALGALWAAIRARAKVTPLEKPQQADGTPLRPRPPVPPPATRPDHPRPRPWPGAPGDGGIIRTPYPPQLQNDDTDVLPVVDVAALRREYRLD